MVKAKDVISNTGGYIRAKAEKTVPSDMPLVDVLPRLLDAPGRLLGVEEEGECIGIIDQSSLLEGIGREITPRDDSSVIIVECAPGDYSASRFAHAVEDSDAHLVDLWSAPAEEGRLKVTLRVRLADPTPAVHSLERYGYEVVEASGAAYQDAGLAIERLLGLQALLNV